MDSTIAKVNSVKLPPPIKQWFVMRDLKRPNSRTPAFRQLPALGFETFTPMHWRVVAHRGKRIREEFPYIPSLVFVHSTQEAIDAIRVQIPTLQYRYVRGGYQQPMLVSDKDMERFVNAVRSVDNPEYYCPEEITDDMIGREVRIVGGQLDGYEGRLLKCQGSKKKRILVSIPNLIVAAIEVELDYIRFV